jgi:hypothetical protein
MRRRTRNTILAILAVVALLLALGALPGLLRSGDPYYMTATAADDGTLPENRSVVDGAALPDERFPYATSALANATAGAPGRSEPYWEGPIGLKEPFTHSPFDELSALEQRNGTATDDAVYVRTGESLYRLAITRENDA